MPPEQSFSPSCPLPLQHYPNVLMAHGGGGKLMHDLIGKLIVPTLQNPGAGLQHDSTVIKVGNQRLAFTTDSYVANPIFFPGGDLGSLAVHGTVNDLAMSGARPLCLSAALIIEEGFAMDALQRILNSMRQAAEQSGVQIITGDTKVVDRGKGDGLFINTSGIGIVEHPLTIAPQSVRSGDVILLNGDLGRHGMAMMSAREGLAFESNIESDSAPLVEPILRMLQEGVQPHCLRDCTRGGLTSVLNEIAEASGLGMVVDEALIAVREDVRAACELLGLDPFQVACEGRFVAFVPPDQVERALEVMNAKSAISDARRIGIVSDERSARVVLRSLIGARRILDMGSGEQLPRIC